MKRRLVPTSGSPDGDNTTCTCESPSPCILQWEDRIIICRYWSVLDSISDREKELMKESKTGEYGIRRDVKITLLAPTTINSLPYHSRYPGTQVSIRGYNSVRIAMVVPDHCNTTLSDNVNVLDYLFACLGRCSCMHERPYIYKNRVEITCIRTHKRLTNNRYYLPEAL